ncbi:unnamed protein product [Meganyctiphanes norvegica]|uniref:BZIP domain-containing protein n=1 Tax=Meganyctiphanes norvegica TaxID=48144 RepID=A0AAV2QMA0_MEGNR
MYLNVNLTPPAVSGPEGSCTTPKTPEILNSLINLTSPPLPQSYSHYQSQVENRVVLSPVSDVSSPAEEFKPLVSSPSIESRPPFELQSPGRERYNSGGSVCGAGGGGGLVSGSPGHSCGYGPLAGASPPSTPDLPSPVSSMEATKSALIKEGLKLQIRTKLQAAGFGPSSIYDESKSIKEEMTEEDEERRRRRRERNKIAATKCRNKKKEKTVILVSESETVEEVNARLKNEIQRLTSEKNHLENLLQDPNHQTSCRHSPHCSHVRPPILIITPADAEEPDPSPSPDPLASPTSSTTSSTSSSTSPSRTPPSSKTPKTPSQLQSPLSSPISNCPSASRIPPTISSHLPCPTSIPSSSLSQFVASKYSPSHLINQRHQPYQYRSSISLQPSSQSTELQTSMSGNILTSLGEIKSYCTPLPSTTPQTKTGYNYTNMEMSSQNHEFTPPNPPNVKSVYTSGRSRSLSQHRYTPYGGRQQHGMSPLISHGHPHINSVVSGSSDNGCESFGGGGAGGNGCSREEHQGFCPEMLPTQFFPPCSYGSM